MAEHTLKEANEVALQAASYFGKVLANTEATFIAAKVDGIVFVVASATAATKLENALVKDKLLGTDTVLSVSQIVLVPRYHAPGEEFPNRGSVHLHVQRDVTLGRRVRKAGECLCGKKRGSREQPPGTHTNVCNECRKVAADNGIEWSL